METSETNRNTVLICLGLIVGTLLVYSQSIGHDFVNFDDSDYVTSNVHVKRGLTIDGIRWAFTTDHASNWHPLTWLSHMLDAQIYGMRPGGHHLTNVILHIANALLLFRFFRRATGAMWPSAVVAALFAWHPLHVESVAWVAERKDVLSTFFWLLAANAYVAYAKHPGTRAYLVTLLFFVLGLLSKPMVVTLPFVLLLLDYWPLKRFKTEAWWVSICRLVREKIPFFILAALGSWITMRVQTASRISAEALPLGARMANALVAYVSYLRKMVWPDDLAVFYPLVPLPMWRAIAAGVFLLAVTIAASTMWRRRPYFLVGWLWFLGMLVPVIGLVQVGGQALADRYTYMPLVGVFVMLVWGSVNIFERWPASQMIAAGAALLACLAVTWFQVDTWRDTETLFRRDLAVASENNFLAHDELGIALDELGHTEEAIVHLKKAMEIYPRAPSPHNSLGWIYEHEQKPRLAEDCYRTALHLKPDFASAHFNLAGLLTTQGRWEEARIHYEEGLRGKPDSAEAHCRLGVVLVRLNKPDQAISHFKRALELWPNFPEAESQWGGALYQLGELDAARRHYEAALRLDPDFAHAHLKLGLILAKQAQNERAKWHLFQAIRLEPTNDAAYYNLAAVSAAEGNLDEAARGFTEASRLNPDDADTHARLAAVLAQSGKFDPAIAQYREAIRLKPDWAEALRALATILATNPKAELRSGAEAVRFAERANELTGGNDPRMLAALDQAYAEVGRFEEAMKIAAQVHTMAATNDLPAIAEAAAQRLELYREGKPNHP